MNIIELREKGKVGDILKYSEKPNVKYLFESYGITLLNARGCRINYWKFLTGEWEIIPPGPKVLSAQELINGNNWESLHHSSLSLNDQVRRDLHNIAEMGRDNGKLEMWLAFEEEYKSNYKSNWPSGITFEYAVKKLKPNQSLEDLGE